VPLKIYPAERYVLEEDHEEPIENQQNCPKTIYPYLYRKNPTWQNRLEPPHGEEE
jgi:hypothetical protein